MLRTSYTRALVIVACWTITVGSAWAESAVDCSPADNLQPFCGFAGSEDLEVLPGARGLLVSECRNEVDATGLLWKPGGVGFLDLTTGKTARLYPHSEQAKGRGDWGDPGCPGEIGNALAPHGMHLSRRGDGAWQLLVVNHGSRQSVELFQVDGIGQKGVPPRLIWRGCVDLGPSHFPNDTVALPKGGFLVTDYTSGATLSEALAKAARGENTGRVLRWRPGRGVEPVTGTEAPLPNGIQLDKAGRTLFVAVGYAEKGEVRKFDLNTGKLLGSVPVPSPDNISWTPDGHLLVASLPPGSEAFACYSTPSDLTQPCLAAFQVVSIDPHTMAAKVLLRHQGPPMGAATVAVQAGDALYMGAVAGGRVLKAPFSKTLPH